MRSTALRQMTFGSTADAAPFVAALGFAPRTLAAGLAGMPSHVQDRWHARLFFAAPLLRVALALFVVATAVIGALPAGRAAGVALLAGLGAPAALAVALMWAACAADLH